MSADESPLWLGLDLSTQSLTLVVLPDAPGAEYVYIDSVQYMSALPQHMTEHGMHVSDGDHGEKVSVCGSLVLLVEFQSDRRATSNEGWETYIYTQDIARQDILRERTFYASSTFRASSKSKQFIDTPLPRFFRARINITTVESIWSRLAWGGKYSKFFESTPLLCRY